MLVKSYLNNYKNDIALYSVSMAIILSKVI